RHLDHARPDAGLADPFGQLTDEDVGHLLDAVAELRPELEIGGRALVFLVEAGCAHDADARRLGHLGHQLDVAAEVDRARIEEGREAQVAELEHAVDAPLGMLAPRGAVGRSLRFPPRPPDHEMLVHQRRAELARRARTRDRLHRLPGYPSLALMRARERGPGAAVKTPFRRLGCRPDA